MFHSSLLELKYGYFFKLHVTGNSSSCFYKLNFRPTGTLVVIYNLKLLDDGRPELDFQSETHDILLSKSTGDFDTEEG